MEARMKRQITEMLVACAAVWVAGFAGPGLAKAMGVPDLVADSSNRPEVSILGHREKEEERIRAFVSRNVHQPFQDSLARWNQPVCPLVVGFSPQETPLVRDRLKGTATAVGARVDSAKCAANFAVIATDDPVAVLEGWSRRDRYLFGDAGGITIDRLLKSDLPVRVWYNVGLRSADGQPMVADTLGPGLRAVETTKARDASRLTYKAVRSFSSVIVVIDRKRAAPLSANQLADYAAMVGLAEIGYEVGQSPDVGDAPTILRLFQASDAERPKGLSAWDTSLLTALYHTNQSLTTQRTDIETRMVHDVLENADK